jgi:hypothetical protein
VAQFAEFELLSLHELLMETTLHAKELHAHMPNIQDSELQRLAQESLESKRNFVNRTRQIIG